MILNKYRINENTFALLPALEINFDTIVIEKDQQLNVRQTGLDIIKKACFDDWPLMTAGAMQPHIIQHSKEKYQS